MQNDMKLYGRKSKKLAWSLYFGIAVGFCRGVCEDAFTGAKKVCKGVRGMPRLMEATKDVLSCEKLRGSAKKSRSGDVRMGKPGCLKGSHLALRQEQTR